MKSADKSSKTMRNFDQLISLLSENEILNMQAMSCVRGGSTDGEGDGGASVNIVPKPPK
jgi:hypothetical protein